jgi:hypothetical protein
LVADRRRPGASPNRWLDQRGHSFDLHLPEQMGAGSVRLTQDDQWISYRLLGATTEEAEVQGETAIYGSAGNDVSFELHSLSNGLKEEIVLADNGRRRFDTHRGLGS